MGLLPSFEEACKKFSLGVEGIKKTGDQEGLLCLPDLLSLAFSP
jgi:hypothetical protein